MDGLTGIWAILLGLCLIIMVFCIHWPIAFASMAVLTFVVWIVLMVGLIKNQKD